MGGSKALKSSKGSTSAVAKTGKKEKQKAAKDKKKAKKATIAPAHQVDPKALSSSKPTNKSTSSTKKSDGPPDTSASATMRVSKKSAKADAPKSTAGAVPRSSSSSTKKSCGPTGDPFPRHTKKMKMIRGTTTTSTSTAGGGKDMDKDKDEHKDGEEAESGGSSSSSSSSSASGSSSSCSGRCSSKSKKPVFSEPATAVTKTSLMKTDRITGAESGKKSKRNHMANVKAAEGIVEAEENEKLADRGAEAADSKCAAAAAAPPAKRSKKAVANVEPAALEVGESGNKGKVAQKKNAETVAASSATTKRNSSKKNTSTSSKAVVGNGRTPAAPAASSASIAKPPTAPIYNTSTTTLTRSTHYIHIEPWTFDDEFFFGHKKALNGGKNDENDGEASTDKDEDSDEDSGGGCGEKEDHVHEVDAGRRFGDLWADDSDEEKCSASADKNPSSSTAGPLEQPGTEAQQQVYRIGGRRAQQDQDHHHDPHGATTSDGRRFQSRPPSTSASMDDDIGRVEQDGYNFPTYEKPASSGPFRPNTKSMKSALRSWCSSSAKMRSSQNVQQVFVARDREDRDSPSATTSALTSSSSSTEASRNCNILHRVVDHPHLPPFQMSQTADNRNLTTTLERIIHDLEDMDNEIDKKKNDAKHVFVVNLEYTQTKDYTDHEDCLGVYTNVKEANWAVVDFLDKWSYEPAFRKIRDNLLANKVKMGGGEVEEELGEKLYDISLNESGRLFEGEKIRIFGEKFALNAPARY